VAQSFNAENIDIDYGHAAAWTAEMPERTRWLRENRPVFWSEKTEAFMRIGISKAHSTFFAMSGKG
jgi:hypothetical protein